LLCFLALEYAFWRAEGLGIHCAEIRVWNQRFGALGSISGVRLSHTIKGWEDARGYGRRGVLLLCVQATPPLLEVF
jgi:hypothetical protein